MKIPWIATEGSSSDIMDLLRETEPVDIIEFTADVFEERELKTLEFDMTETVQAWADGAENQGIYITTGEGWDNGEYLELYGVSAGITEEQEKHGDSVRPYLEIVTGIVVTWQPPGQWRTYQ